MKTIRGITAIGLAGLLTFSASRPAKSNPVVLAPAACATGVGCVLVGVAVVGGALVWVWQNNQTHKEHVFRIEDAEEEMERMGKNAQNGRTILARDAAEAHSRCSQWAGGRLVAVPQNLGNGRWLCRYY